MSKPHTLILLAHEIEIPEFEKRVLKAGYTPLICGVGQNESFYRFSQYLHENGKPASVLHVGTCGVLAQKNLMSKSIYSCDYCLPPYEHEQYPDIVQKEWGTIDPALIKKDNLHGVQQKFKIYSAAGISTDTIHLKKPEQQNVYFENMEAAPLSYLCYRCNIPFASVLNVTNEIGPDGRQQWKENFQKAGTSLDSLLDSLFANGSLPGELLTGL